MLCSVGASRRGDLSWKVVRGPGTGMTFSGQSVLPSLPVSYHNAPLMCPHRGLPISIIKLKNFAPFSALFLAKISALKDATSEFSFQDP